MNNFRAVLLICAAFFSTTVSAHSPASSQLTVSEANGEYQLTADLAIIDLATLLPIDTNNDSRITWGELLAAQSTIDQQVRSAAQIDSGGNACNLRLQPRNIALIRYGTAEHLSLPYATDCATSAELNVAFGMFFELDPGHRVFLRDTRNSGLQVLTRDRPVAALGDDGPGAGSLLREGVAHILEGYDHLLFLMLLVLPAFTASGMKVRLLHLAGIVTTFTIAHSITLGLAAMGFIALPGKPVEIAIALSIVAAGIMNIWKPRHRIGWKLAGGFGLLHGFGFAGALAEIGFGGSDLVLNLLAFNLGVEFGQLLVVALALPFLAVLAHWSRYSAMVVPAASAAGVALGLAWTFARL